MESGNVSVEYCPTKSMVADFFTKHLQGRLFLKLKHMIRGQNECSMFFFPQCVQPNYAGSRSVLDQCVSHVFSLDCECDQDG